MSTNATTPPAAVTVIGLGNMGLPMAALVSLAGDGDLLGVQGSVPLRYAKHSRRAWGKTRWSR